MGYRKREQRDHTMDFGSPLHADTPVGTLPSMPPGKRRPDVSWLPVLLRNVQVLLDQGEATRGCTATVRGGHIIVARVDAAGADPRSRMTLLKGDTYGLSLYHRKKWDPLPFQGTPNQLVDIMNTALAHWAVDWTSPDLEVPNFRNRALRHRQTGTAARRGRC